MANIDDAQIVREMRALREDGELPGGVLIAGRVYRKFSLGLVTGNMSHEAAREINEDKERSMSKAEAAMYAKRLRFAGLDPESLTYQAIMELPSIDMDEIYAADERLKEKYRTFRGRKVEADAADGRGGESKSGPKPGGGTQAGT